MEFDELPDHVVYSKNVIEFVTVVAETCIFLERTNEYSKKNFVEQMVKFLPLLYMKTVMLEIPEPELDGAAERFVTEDDYLFVRNQIETLLAVDDAYLEVFHPDMSMSDTPIAAFISEDLSDVYQEIKDFAVNYQTAESAVMNDALIYCLDAFNEHWGRKLLNALKALHAIKSECRWDDESAEVEDDRSTVKNSRNSIFSFQKDADDEDFDELL
jgi:Domain of unknown function (DUF5063)